VTIGGGAWLVTALERIDDQPSLVALKAAARAGIISTFAARPFAGNPSS
jgi:hypothetical protein